jgi:hypothetical protein
MRARPPHRIKYSRTPPIFRRYAETQLAANGLRYRDWLTVFASAHALEKCRQAQTLNPLMRLLIPRVILLCACRLPVSIEMS